MRTISTGDDDPTRAGENLKEFREVCVREEEGGGGGTEWK